MDGMWRGVVGNEQPSSWNYQTTPTRAAKPHGWKEKAGRRGPRIGDEECEKMPKKATKLGKKNSPQNVHVSKPLRSKELFLKSIRVGERKKFRMSAPEVNSKTKKFKNELY